MNRKTIFKYAIALLITSTLFGLAIAKLYNFYGNRPWTITLEVALITGLLFGFLLSLSAYFTDRLLLAPIGFLLGGLMAYVALNAPVGVWQPLTPTPEPVTSVVADLQFLNWPNFPYIRTRQNHMYSYECSATDRPCEWVLMETPPPAVPIENGQCGIHDLKPPYPVTPLLLGKIVQWVQYYICGAEDGEENNVVLLDDGSLWQWKFDSSAWEAIVVYPGGVIAGVVVGLIGMLIPLRSWWQQRKKPRKRARPRPAPTPTDAT